MPVDFSQDAAPVIDAVMDASKKLLENYRISRIPRVSRGVTPCDSESLIPCWLLILCVSACHALHLSTSTLWSVVCQSCSVPLTPSF